MTPVVEIDEIWQEAAERFRKLSGDEVIPLLKQYGMMSQLVREVVIDCGISSIELSQDEIFAIYKQFYQDQQLNSDADLEAWLNARKISRQQLEYGVTRGTKLEKFKRATWGSKLESYFIQRKPKLDRVVYSLLRINDIGIAQELYFRIQEGEQTFQELASKYSQGAEAETGGLLGPVELATPHPALANLLATSQPGQLLPPTRLGEWFIILRLEKLIPAKLDEPTQQRLLNELFENWLQNQVKAVMSNES
ncbi:MAG: peptidylprolyl isomerase [Calothrix sp. C42_A2020_038]|nr:peptidylprolyl isomerase [Calothrix sp. C42_A2020_038]